MDLLKVMSISIIHFEEQEKQLSYLESLQLYSYVKSLKNNQREFEIFNNIKRVFPVVKIIFVFMK